MHKTTGIKWGKSNQNNPKTFLETDLFPAANHTSCAQLTQSRWFHSSIQIDNTPESDSKAQAGSISHNLINGKC